MSRLGFLGTTATVLFFANSLIWALQAPAQNSGEGAFQGCSQPDAPLPSKDDLLRSMDPKTIDSAHPKDNCAGCSLVLNTTQNWCKYRPPGTECFIGPMFDNFRFQRPYRIYQCAGGFGVC